MTLYFCTETVTISPRGPPNLSNFLFERQKLTLPTVCLTEQKKNSIFFHEQMELVFPLFYIMLLLIDE